MDLHEPWLVAVWPGMGHVALSAGNFLLEHLHPELLTELPAEQYFDVEKVSVEHGLIAPGKLPANKLYGWANPRGRDLLLFVGEAQPSLRSYRFSRELLELARDYGVTRVYTFAAMVTASHPSSPSRVFAVATSRHLLEEVRGLGRSVGTLEQGEITGLNGTLLAAAGAMGLEGIGLLGELPQIARNVPYFKSSRAVLDLFARLGGVELDLSPLDRQAESMERSLIELVDRIQKLVDSGEKQDDEPSWLSAADEVSGEISSIGEVIDPPPIEPAQPSLAPETVSRIESLFSAATRDRTKALELKAILDEHGVFKAYEDRFLDLFKR